MSKNQKISKLAAAITGFYLLALIASVLIMFLTTDDTSMSGIFLVVVSIPWPWLLTQLQDILSLDSMLFNTLFLTAGGLLNTFIIYKFITFIINRSRQ